MLEHRHIADIVDYLTPNDLLVVNDTKVFPARRRACRHRTNADF
ncbi:MAG: S-adenosylmethionine:tRNA ribosyltransferase-isomerase [Neisseriaceae bacterium]|nr:S-adenosylmethionine:tRNA ribosyltransferase-isomerase [Neisseriaceae bacterium]